MEIETKEILIGSNLDKALSKDGYDAAFLIILDGRERKNPAYRLSKKAKKGSVYVVTRTDGTAPGEVDYFGVRIA